MKRVHLASLCAVGLAAVVIVTGAYITSSEIVAHDAQQHFVPNVTIHLALGIVLLLAALAPAYLARSLAGAPRILGWTGFVTVAAICALGWSGAPLSAAIGVAHALLSHLYFVVAVVLALTTSAHWTKAPELAEAGRSYLRPLAAATPPVVLLQITLGALYRHNVIGIILHVAVAMAVAMLALVLCSVILQNYARPAPLRAAAGTLMGVVLLQVAFGIVSLVMLLLNFTASGYFIAATVTHVLVGAATLASSVVLAMVVSRSMPAT